MHSRSTTLTVRDAVLRSSAAVVLALIAGSIARPSSAEIISGTYNLGHGPIDFSTQQTAVLFEDEDVGVAYIFSPPLGWKILGHAVVRLATPIDSVLVAPGDSSSYFWHHEIVVGDTYVVRTSEGHYAKFALTDWNGAGFTPIIFFYQDDESLNLRSTISVENTTWGRIKELFRD